MDKMDMNGDINQRNNIVSSKLESVSSQIQTNDNDQSVVDGDSDSDDDYFLSDEDELNNIVSSSNDNHSRLNYSTSMSDHVAYFSNLLSHTLESLQLDKSLVLQAQLSGHLNSEKQKIVDKNNQVVEKVENIKRLYIYNFSSNYDHFLKLNISRVEKLRQDITDIESRIEKLKSGSSKNSTSTFGSIFKIKNRQIGVVNNYPVEYNQSKDKVLERQIDE